MKYGIIEKPVFSRVDNRGSFHELYDSGEWQSIIAGKMKTGAVMGNHYHKFTTVSVYLTSGKAIIETYNLTTKERSRCEIGALQGYVFRPEEVRQITYLEDSDFLLLKTHRYDHANPDLIDYKGAFSGSV